MTIGEIRTFNSKIRKLERLSEQYLNSKIKIEIENKKLKQKLKNTRKALDVAKDTLHWYDDNYDSVVARNTLDEIKTITAPEEKDVK